MTSSRIMTRASPSRRLKDSGQPSTAQLAAQVPLPPSPPSSDALILDQGLHQASPARPPQPSRRRVSPRRSKVMGPRDPVQPSTSSLPRNTSHRALQAAIQSSPHHLSQTRSKKRRVVQLQDPFASRSSSPSSPTISKSSRFPKRPKASAASPITAASSSSPNIRPLRDSPNNPFLVHPGEKPRRAGAKRDDEYRKVVYVFRGKRIQYDSGEDLNETGGSPFSGAVPRLLFPSPPSPDLCPEKPKQKACEEEEEGRRSGSPRGRRNQPAFETPKRDKAKTSAVLPESSLPTPQSRPRPRRSTLPPILSLTAPIKASKSMAIAMR
ncbi:hypothetical protein PGT21_020300 [Puccinia graminis f. sp. tritici]|uniref:Uncharacterized protein n=1 Tax=Puccinia graminis f. sp. tritici TaxID=56615 RepID=A0A5B0Q6E4_PUCGR|nr:hypothetical protein PGT21_020300 [Puccinia graminis f. sp. tritici]